MGFNSGFKGLITMRVLCPRTSSLALNRSASNTSTGTDSLTLTQAYPSGYVQHLQAISSISLTSL